MLFGLQQVLVPFGMLILGLLCLGLFDPGGKRGLSGTAAIFNAYPGMLGSLFAFWVKSRWSDTARTGRWIWVFPLLVCLWDLFVIGPRYNRLDYFFASPGDTEGLPLVLETIPTFGTICYSLGMIFPAKVDLKFWTDRP